MCQTYLESYTYVSSLFCQVRRLQSSALINRDITFLVAGNKTIFNFKNGGDQFNCFEVGSVSSIKKKDALEMVVS